MRCRMRGHAQQNNLSCRLAGAKKGVRFNVTPPYAQYNLACGQSNVVSQSRHSYLSNTIPSSAEPAAAPAVAPAAAAAKRPSNPPTTPPIAVPTPGITDPIAAPVAAPPGHHPHRQQHLRFFYQCFAHARLKNCSSDTSPYKHLFSDSVSSILSPPNPFETNNK